MAFLVFEGLDGSGKSTLIRGLGEKLKLQNMSFHVTREPGGTELGEELRKIILRVAGDTPTPRTELLLYQAIRAQHVDNVIRPTLDKGDWILCDRFTASSLAFQSGGRGLDETDIVWLSEFSTGGLKPDLWVLLDLPTEESAQRMQKRTDSGGQALDRFEQENQSFHNRVRENYLSLAKRDPDNWLVLDAGKSPEEILGQLLAVLEKRKWLEL